MQRILKSKKKDDDILEAPVVAVIPKVVQNTCNHCGHQKDQHYGGERGWCNKGDCRCLEFK